MLDKCVAVLLSCIGWATVTMAAEIPADLRKAVEDYDHAQVNANGADIWARRNGKWQVVYTHVSVPPQPSSSG